MIGKDQISESMAYVDAESEEFVDQERFWRKRDVDPSAIHYCAMQHGLRVVMLKKGLAPNPTRPTPVPLSPTEQAEQVQHAGSWLAGAAMMFDLMKRGA